MLPNENLRNRVKRTIIPNEVPTINTGSTLVENDWLTTDIMVGEMFANVEDDRLWLRTNSGIHEIYMSASTQSYPYDYECLLTDTLSDSATGFSSSKYFAPRDFEIQNIKATCDLTGATPSFQKLVIDVYVNDILLTTDPIEIEAEEYTSVTAENQPSLAFTNINENAKITFNIIQTSAKKLPIKVQLIGKAQNI